MILEIPEADSKQVLEQVPGSVTVSGKVQAVLVLSSILIERFPEPAVPAAVYKLVAAP